MCQSKFEVNLYVNIIIITAGGTHYPPARRTGQRERGEKLFSVGER